MASLSEYRDEQLVKLSQLKKLGINPYPSDSNADTAIADIRLDFDTYKGQDVCVAGRLLSHRQHGKIQFIDVESSGQIVQLIASEDMTTDHKRGYLGFGELDLLTRGDIIEAGGVVGLSNTGESSIELKQLRILAKVLRPLPERLDNKEVRLRRRYLDLTINPEVRQRFVRRSRFWQATRDFLNEHGFLEINTPVLEHTTGGADAKPFVTHMDSLGEEFYLRISHELPLKRLLGGGFEKVYDIGPRFRNENYSDEHLPEHVSMEWYWAYANWRDGIRLGEALFRKVAQGAFGKTTLDWQGHTIDLKGEWPEWDYAETIAKHYKIDVFNTTTKEINTQLKKHNLTVEDSSIPRGIDKLWKNIRQSVAGPVWLVNIPVFLSPLSKVNMAKPQTTERFLAVIVGSELSNGFSELNDPIDQLNRFMEQQKLRQAGDEEAHMLDIDYVEMLEYGMPPACGFSFSERFFWLFEGVSAREGVPFPQLRREIDETTRKIYPQLYGS